MPVPSRKSPIIAALALAAASPLAMSQAMLEEIIVTAQKRAESLQDVPISVSAIQGDKIQDAGIPNMAALADYVPNLFISDAPVSTNIYMRGMGSSNNQAFEQSVGMYIDGIYMGRGRQYRQPFMDIERVEVLRGPQGTLFGRNTVAGAISVITASPDLDEEFNGRIEQSIESNKGYITEGMVSGAVTDTMAARLVGRYRQVDGYVQNDFLSQDEAHVEEWNYRFTGVWSPSEKLDVNLKWGQSNLNRDGVASGVTYYADAAERDALYPNRSAFANIAYLLTDTFYPQINDAASEEFRIFKDNNLGPTQGASGVAVGKYDESSDQDTDNGALTINYYMGDYTLTAVTGYSAYNYKDGCDCDWLPLQFIARDDDQDFDQVSQEIRLASPTGGFFEYLAGAYYETNTVKFDRRVTIDTNMGLVGQVLPVDNLFTLLSGGLYTADQIARNHKFKLDTDSWAVFAQGTFNLREDLRVTLGLRYTDETKEVESSQFLSDNLTGLGTRSDNFFLYLTQATSFNTYLYDYDEDRDTDELLPSANVQWDVTDDMMLYASYSEGFKSGGFTAADDGEPGDLVPGTWPCAPGQLPEDCYNINNPNDQFEFDDENVTAYEIGGKHTLLDGAMTLNWAAFYTEYDDLQTSIFQGISFSVTNAAEAEIKGVEFDMLWQATEGLRLGLNGAWLDAEYTDYKTAPCTAAQLDADALCGTGQPGATFNDLSNENTTFAPDYTASAFFDYSYLMGNGMEFFAGGEVNYSDEFDTQGDLDPLDKADDYTKVNLRLGLRASDESWELMVYGRNITDEEALIYSFDVPVLVGSHASMVDEGRVYGARLRYNFN